MRCPPAIALIPIALIPSLLPAEENPHGDVFKNRPVPAVVDFNRDVRPVISEKCYHCHGPDDKARKAKLRLDLRPEALKEHDDGLPIKPGDPEHSQIIDRVTTTDKDEIMPPPKDGAQPLTTREVEILKKWIKQGAPYAEHWAFIKPTKTEDLKTKDGRPESGGGIIDHLILQKLQENGMKMSPRADMHTLVRRLALDLTGLPPTPEETARFTEPSFVHQASSFEKVVDHYLASPAYGERWARVWLDVARYADSAGYGSDPLRMNIWPYRDWVIHAFNKNMPYDQFTLEQLAGDLLPNATEEQRVATAFHRNTMTNTEGGTDDEEFRVAAVKDRIAVTIQAWMGLTMGCAQCHSHKFDPITQQEYYQFYAIFNQTEDSDKPDESPTMPFPTEEQRAKTDALKAEIATLEQRMNAPSSPELEKELTAWETKVMQPVAWTTLKPQSAKARTKGTDIEINEDGTLFPVGNNPPGETLTVKVKTATKGITAFRLEALTDDRLPQKGPGRSDNGNAVLDEFRVAASALPANAVKGRYVRLEISGKQKLINIAEVEVFAGGKNIAVKGKATQSGMYADAEAKRAIDGKTDGDYKHNSVAHTAVTDNPWWEVDLGSEQELEKVVVWNRTDGGTASRLSGAKLSVLDAKRQPAFSKIIEEAPAKSEAFALSNSRVVKLQNATAEYEQSGFDAARAIDGAKETGWAFGGATGKPHAIVFECEQPVGDGQETELTFVIEQGSVERHNLGRIRLSATTQALPVRELSPSIKAIIAKPATSRSVAEKKSLLAYYKPQSKLFADTKRDLDAKRAALAAVKPLGVPVLVELPKDKLRETHFLNKGNFLDPGVKVEPALLKSFNPAPPEAPTRVAVAKWLTSRDNPLTARVMANRLWAQLFGIGIVETEEDFGTQGALPSHPELLDALALEFMNNGWNIKALLKTIVMSDAYQQSSKVTPEALAKDPRNRLLSHYPRRRLDAEQVRDQALALSGLLSHKMGGPSVYPPQPDGLWRAAFNGQRSWETSKGDDRYRRGLYTFWRRTVPYPSMATFDAPSRENTTLRRVPTNTPLQAFVTLNDPAFFEMAQALAARMIREGGDSADSRVKFGLELCLARPATMEQITALTQLLGDELSAYKSKEQDAKKLATSATLPKEKAFPADHDAAELAAYVEVANVLLNLDGVLTKG